MTLEALRLLRDTTFFWTRRRASHLHAHQESLNVASFVYKYAVVYCLYLIGSQPNLLLLFFPPGDDFVGDKVLNVLSRHTRRFALGDSFCFYFYFFISSALESMCVPPAKGGFENMELEYSRL